MVSSANQSSRSISPSSPQAGHHLLHLVGDGGGVAAHELVPQGLVVQHLAPALRRRVEDDALAEDRRHEGVGLGLVEQLLGGPEEELVGVGPGEQHDVALGRCGTRPTSPHSARTRAHERDRVDAQLVEVPVLAVAARHPGRLAQFDRRWSWCLSSWSCSGASGWTSIDGEVRAPRRGHRVRRWPGHAVGAQEVAEWRARPQRAHSLDHLGGDVGVPVHPHVGQGRAGPHDRWPARRSPRAPSAARVTNPSSAPLRRHVGGHARPRVRDDVGGDEDQVAAPARHHAGAEAPAPGGGPRRR